MAAERFFPRFAEPRLKEALADTPVVLLHGPRQCGKTTLARHLGAKAGYAYKSFDDEVTLAAARSDPIGFVADLPAKCILDEVQRAPGIFRSLKMAVDENRTPGRFLLTGSANVLLVPALGLARGAAGDSAPVPAGAKRWRTIGRISSGRCSAGDSRRSARAWAGLRPDSRRRPSGRAGGRHRAPPGELVP